MLKTLSLVFVFSVTFVATSAFAKSDRSYYGSTVAVFKEAKK